MNPRKYRQTRSLENIGEDASMSWYRNTNHLTFINEKITSETSEPPKFNEIIERYVKDNVWVCSISGVR